MQCGWRNGAGGRKAGRREGWQTDWHLPGGRKAGRREGWQTDWHQEGVMVAGWCPREEEGASLAPGKEMVPTWHRADRRQGPNNEGWGHDTADLEQVPKFPQQYFF